MTRPPLAALAFTLALAIPGRADNWPQWRGPNNDGRSTETGLPVEWDQTKNVVWKLKLPGRGASTPAVWGDRIFLTSLDGESVVLLCVGTDGKEKWRQKLGSGGRVTGRGGEGDDASASPITDGTHVWAASGNGALACFTVDGKPVWEQDLQKYGRFGIQFGIHWTPALHKDKLFLQVMHRNAQKVVALDARTGKELWAVDRPGYGRGESPDTYASVGVWDGPGGPLVIAHGNDYCTAHKADTGEEVWRVNGLNPTTNPTWRFVSSPLITPELIVVPSCKSGPTVAVDPAGAKGAIEPGNPAERWRFKNTPDVVSPLLVDGLVYLLGDGTLTAVDAKTGRLVYSKALEAKQRVYRANMVAADGKIYLVGREGIGFVVQAGPEFKVLATNDLKEVVYSSPAISNGRLYLRGRDHLYAIGAK
ncbi:MAG: PQQ-binding-like beta-propeller repeat protein [Gemmataceae bacterium]|nr:PQQ-binding-like beta-propeller repeat protein [Gemmataceae bacterium]